MKKQILTLILAIAAIITTSTVSAAANKTTAAKEGYTVNSVIDGRTSTTAFDKNGNWVYTVQQYSPASLDKRIMDKATDGYHNYGITSMQKIEQPGTDAVYIVRLENAKSLKTVRISNDDVELVQDYIKL
ncbi:hypothetical protein BH10BAC2_BH10BAC2_01750 [soil metagenome]